MYAVIRTGGKQYRVAPGDVIAVEKLAGVAGDTVTFGDVLMLGDDKSRTVGSPTIADAAVLAEVVEQTRGNKITVFKFKRRKGYRRTRGHRQDLTVVRISKIGGEGAQEAPAAKAAMALEARAGEAEATETAVPRAGAEPSAPRAETVAENSPVATEAPAQKPVAKADDDDGAKE